MEEEFKVFAKKVSIERLVEALAILYGKGIHYVDLVATNEDHTLGLAFNSNYFEDKPKELPPSELTDDDIRKLAL